MPLAAGGAAGALTGALLNGANFGQVAKATLIGAFWGAVSGALNYYSADPDLIAKVFKHTFTQGFLEGVQGGNAVHGMMMGAVSGAGGHFARNNLSDMGYAGQLVSSAVISGTVSEIGGGKFANGAITGAFAFMFNDAMHKSINWSKVVNELEKLYSEYNEKNNPELYASMGGEIKSEVYDKEPMLAKNACALKLCLALEKAGFYIPDGTSNTLKAANGKSYFVSAKYFFEFLRSNDGVYTKKYDSPKHLFNSFKTGIYYQGERLDGKAGAHIDARYNGKGGRMYKQFKTNYGLYW